MQFWELRLGSQTKDEPMKNIKPYISASEAARKRGLSRHTIYDLIHAGQIITDERGRILRAPFEQYMASLTAFAKEQP